MQDAKIINLLAEIEKSLKVNIKDYLMKNIEFGVARIEYQNITIMYTSNKRYGGGGDGFYLIISNRLASDKVSFGSRSEIKINSYLN